MAGAPERLDVCRDLACAMRGGAECLGELRAGAAIWRRHRLARPLAIGIALATLLVFAAFWIAVALGVPYEVRTIGAMTLRSAFWVVVATVLMRARQG